MDITVRPVEITIGLMEMTVRPVEITIGLIATTIRLMEITIGLMTILEASGVHLKYEIEKVTTSSTLITPNPLLRGSVVNPLGEFIKSAGV